MEFRRKLPSSFFDTVDWTNLNTETAESAAPVVDVILGPVGDNCVFGTDQPAGVTGDANRSDFQAELVHNHHYKAKHLWNN